MQMSAEEIWDPNDPYKYYTPRDLGDNFFLLERTSTIKKAAEGGGGGGEEEVERVSRTEAEEDDDVGVYVLIETDDGKVTVAPANAVNGVTGSETPEDVDSALSSKANVAENLEKESEANDHVTVGSGRWIRCKDCDYRTQRKEVLKMHRRRVHPEECEEEDDRKQAEEDKVHNSPPSGGYKCGLCDFTATVGYLMAAHVKKEHKGYKKCKRCNQVVTIRDFASHLNRVHAVTLKPKGGRISPKSKTAKKQPKVRRNSNRSPTPDDAALRNPDAKIEKLPENGGWRCPHCEHVCASYSNMQVHFNVKHLGIRQFKCKLCDYSAGQKVHLQSHVERVHNGGGDAEDEEVEDLMHEDDEGMKKEEEYEDESELDVGEAADLSPQNHILKEIELAPEEGNGGDRNWHPSHYGNRKKTTKPSPSSSSKVSSIVKKCPRCDYSTPKGFNMRTHIMSMHLGKKPFNCVEGENCKFAAATKSKLIAHMINLHSKTHLEAKNAVDQREFDLTIPEDFEASPHKANADPETPAKSNRRKRVSAKRVPDPSQNPRKVVALGADVSGLGTPAAGRVGLRRKAKTPQVQEDKKPEVESNKPTEAIRVLADGRLACNLCNYSAFKEVSLERHKRSAHSGTDSGKIWSCSECDFVSGSKYEYVLHCNKQHNG